MDIVEISNLFNRITTEHPNITTYHFGWGSDINRNIQNNYDPKQSKGNMFPLVHWVAPPFGDMHLVQRIDEIEVNLHFYNTLYRDNDAAFVSDTLLETWRNLRLWAFQFIKEIEQAGKALAPQGKGLSIKENKVRWSSDSNVHNDDLVLVSLSFTLQTNIACADLKLGLETPPAPFTWPPSSIDRENQNT